MNAPTEALAIPAQRIRAALRAMPQADGYIDQVLDGAGFTADDCYDPDFVFTLSALVKVATNLTKLMGADWFLKIPVLWRSETQSTLGVAMRSAPDLRTALEVQIQFYGQVWPFGTWEWQSRGSTMHLVFLRTRVLPLGVWELIEPLAALNFQTLLRAAIGFTENEIVYEFEGPPREYSKTLEQMIAGQVRWNRDGLRIIVPDQWLSRSLVTADALLFSAVMQQLRQKATSKSGATTTADQVRQILGGVTVGQLSQAEVAQHLRMSSSTLERRLREHETTFRDLQAESLRARLLNLIDAPRMTAAVLAQRLGYHDTSGLQRVCKRWFGKTYRQLRLQHIGGQHDQ